MYISSGASADTISLILPNVQFSGIAVQLIEKIEVHQIEGVGKNRTQRIVIHYRFVGCIEISACPKKSRYTAETRKGVAVNYLTA